MVGLQMIDYIITIYQNYDLLQLQLMNFRRRLSPGDYRLIIVDNTPLGQKQTIQIDPQINHLILPIEFPYSFDAASHGSAIDYGLTYASTPIVAILDSDFFILHNDIHDYVDRVFSQGFKAVGCEYNDGDLTKNWVNINPKNFENIPCCFGAYYTRELATSASWALFQNEIDCSTAFIETGAKIRRHILNNNVKTMNWKTDAYEYGMCYFKDQEHTMGMHYLAGSHRRWTTTTFSEIQNVIETDYN